MHVNCNHQTRKDTIRIDMTCKLSQTFIWKKLSTYRFFFSLCANPCQRKLEERRREGRVAFISAQLTRVPRRQIFATKKSTVLYIHSRTEQKPFMPHPSLNRVCATCMYRKCLLCRLYRNLQRILAHAACCACTERTVWCVEYASKKKTRERSHANI